MDIPTISQYDLASFYFSHFSSTCVDHFIKNFIWPEEIEDLEDDNLGYYRDGTKRTLTDEQIAIFRHSELQSLMREERSTGNSDEEKNPNIKLAISKKRLDKDNYQSIKKCVPNPPNKERPLPRKLRKALKAEQKGYFRQSIKPDLRKRTWDKVEEGLGSLDYDESQIISTERSMPSTQRRKVSYDD